MCCTNLSETAQKLKDRHRAYSVRWLIVLILALVNGSNAYLWISFAPVADHFVAFYSTNEQFLNWALLIFPITTVLFGLPATFLVDYFGVRFVILASVTMNLLCGLLRVMSSMAFLSSFVGGRLALIIVGQLIASFAQPLCMFTPVKLALDWFPENQHTIANTLGSLGNTVGILIGSAIAPLLVQRPQDIPVFNYISLGIVGFGFIVSCIVVRTGKPPTPPSTAASVSDQVHQRWAQSENISVLQRLKYFVSQCIEPLRSASFCLLMLAFACGLAYFTTLSTLFQQMLCTKGYSNQFAGLCGSLMIVTGLIASAFSAIFADRTGLLLEAVQVCYTLAIVGAVGFGLTLWFSHQTISTMFCVCWLGAWGFSQYSLALELAAEATFPVPESITSGLLIIVSQILSVVFVSFMQAAAPIATPNMLFTPTCGPAATPQDYGIPNMVLCAILVVIAIVQLFCLRLPYKRRDAWKNFPAVVNLNVNSVFPVESTAIIETPTVTEAERGVACESMETAASVYGVSKLSQMSSHSVTKSDNKNNNDDYEAEKSNACLFQSEIKSYRFRWLIVITLASVSGTNAFLWLSMAPVTNHFVQFYATTENTLNWIQLSFSFTLVLLGPLTCVIVDKWSTRTVILLSAVLHAICGVCRALSSALPVSKEGRLALLALGQAIASVAEPFCLFAPTKMALTWFPDNERTAANGMANFGNLLGGMMTNAITPFVVRQSHDIPRYNYICLGVTTLILIVALTTIRYRYPPKPPSKSAVVTLQKRDLVTDSVSHRMSMFVVQAWRSLHIAGFWLLLTSFGFSVGYFTVFNTLIEQILCAKGYANSFAGLGGSVMIASAAVGTILSGVFADRTGLLFEALKVCSLLSSLGCVGLGMALWFPDQKAVLLLCLAWLGGFGFAQYSLALEMAAEATYPVPESITTGLLIMASQLVAIVLLPVMQKLAPIAKPNAYFHPVCGPDSSPLDYAIPNLVYCALYVLIAIAQMTFLRLSYVRRLAAQNVQTPISAVEQIPAADTSRHEYWSNLEAPVLRRASL
ncbi:hypothetical protein D915_006690 [Fasciola hepatica]|uniref:Uncharacterized protein n=1 Tax=Fasciola hepatica TaxID=6192 RepID=A0A4E0RQ96_FASHE|nr:hypothetical protein D915_006690 [Fasciola hepatica]